MTRFVLLAWLSGCFLLPGKSHGLSGGETLYVAEDTRAFEVMANGLHKEDHRQQSRGRPLPVIAAGAVVRVATDYKQQREMQTNGAALADRNPWILVEVVESPVAGQRGWKGWVHLDTMKKERVAPAAPALVELPRQSLLCPWADANDALCNVNLAAHTGVHVLGCAGPRVQVELFTGNGLYIHGFVNASQFPSPPCTTASKE